MEWLAWLCSVPDGLGEDSSSVSSLSKGTSSLLPPSTGSESSSDEPEMEMCRQGCGPASSGCTDTRSDEGLPTGSLLPQWDGGERTSSSIAPSCWLRSAGGNILPIDPLEAGHRGDAEDAGGADGDAGFHCGFLTDAEQTDLPHVAIAVANPNFMGAFRAAVAGRSTGELQGRKRRDELGHLGMMQELSAPSSKHSRMERTTSSNGMLECNL